MDETCFLMPNKLHLQDLFTPNMWTDLDWYHIA